MNLRRGPLVSVELDLASPDNTVIRRGEAIGSSARHAQGVAEGLFGGAEGDCHVGPSCQVKYISECTQSRYLRKTETYYSHPGFRTDWSSTRWKR